MRTLAAVVGYCVLAVALTWPLATRLDGTLPGDPAGDTGVYVWNFWVVRHELERGRVPFHTERIFAATGTADLSQHNATLAPAIVAAPFVDRLGVVRTFNLTFLALIATCGVGVYLLSAYLTRRPVESWLAGALTCASPAVLARSTEHLSLLAIGVVPLFLLGWQRMLDRQTGWSAVCAGVAMAVAAYSDPYLAIYCALLAAWLLAAALLRVTSVHRGFFAFGGDRRRVLDGLLVAVAGVALSIVTTGGWSVTVLGVAVHGQTLYTPMLALTVLLVLRVTWWASPRVDVVSAAPTARIARLAGVAASVAVLCLSPWLLALYTRFATGRLASPDILWRSSPTGVDLAAYVAPSAMHPLWGDAVRAWLERLHPAGFAEFTPSLSLTAIALVLVAAALGLKLPRRWVWLAAGCAACGLGPFVHVFGVNNFVPGPWALLRYAPIVEWARSPSRFALVAAIGVGVVAAHALAGLRERLPQRAGAAVVAVVALLGVVEFWPQPWRLHAAAIPHVFATIAADPDRAVTVLELPVGIRDGTSSMGDFRARTQFFQTRHEKRLIGGYLSRISQRRKDAALEMPVFSALLALSEGRTIDPAHVRRARERRDEFVARTRLRYIVIDTRRCSPELRRFAEDVLLLDPLGSDGGYELYRVAAAPPPPVARPEPPRRRGAMDPLGAFAAPTSPSSR